jgi:CheY-like chemotaxis protein
VHSEEGKGATFTLYFPATRDEAAAAERTASLAAYKGSESILIVDDMKEQRELALSMLGRFGYHVEAVPGGEDAVARLRNGSADLVVLDMIMDSGMDGLDTYREILKIHPRQKAIIVSGFAETDRVRHAQALGAGAFVRKPYIMEKIGLAVRQELDRK